MRPLHIVILAARQGTRMRSDLPETHHPLVGLLVGLHVSRHPEHPAP